MTLRLGHPLGPITMDLLADDWANQTALGVPYTADVVKAVLNGCHGDRALAVKLLDVCSRLGISPLGVIHEARMVQEAVGR